MVEALGECYLNFDTLALFQRRGNVAQMLTLILWLGHSLEYPKVAQITSKSTPNRSKIIKNWYLEWLWAPLGFPLEASWAPLGCRMPKTIKKVTWRTPPGGAKGGRFGHLFATFCQILRIWWSFFAGLFFGGLLGPSLDHPMWLPCGK